MAEFDERVSELEFPEDLDPARIPTFSQLPLGRLEAEIKGWQEQDTPVTDKSPVSKKVVKVQFAVVDTVDHKYIGLPHSETFWIGSDMDPKAQSPATWKANAGRIMKLLKKAKVSTTKGIKFRQMMDASVGSRLILEVKENRKTELRFLDFLSVGEKPLEYFERSDEAPAGAIPNGHANPLNPPSVFDNE